jgi:hypothetical protein
MAEAEFTCHTESDCLEQIDRLNSEADAARGILWALYGAVSAGASDLPDDALPNAVAHAAKLVSSIQTRAGAIFEAYGVAAATAGE